MRDSFTGLHLGINDAIVARIPQSTANYVLAATDICVFPPWLHDDGEA